MNHKRLSLFLKAAGCVAALGGAAVFFGYAPSVGREAKSMYPALAWLFWPMLLYIWGIGGVYAAALAQYMCICGRIGQNRSFCAENAKGMRLIGTLLFVASGLWLALIIVSALMPQGFGPAWLIFLLAAMASFAVGVVARVMAYLVRRAAQLQEDSDLTV